MGSWSSAGDLNAGVEGNAGAGIYNAALSFGGDDRENSKITTEEYNGVAWSLGGDMPVATTDLAGCGVQSAALGYGGSLAAGTTDSTIEYNGTVWSSGGNLGVAVIFNAGCGVQTAALSFGGSGGSNVTITEEYNGTVWSAGGNLGIAISKQGGCGTQSAALSFGGGWGSVVTEEYNGNIWAGGGDLNNSVSANAGGGEQTAAISFGGWEVEVPQAITEEYNGTAWSEGGSLSTARQDLAGAGTKSLGLAFGGSVIGPYISAVTETYSITYGQHKGISGIDGGILFAGKTIIGDRTNGKLYALDMDTYTDAGEIIKRTRRTQIINKERVNVMHNRLEIEFEPGVGLDVASSADGYDPQAVLRWSDDGGKNWSNEYSTSIGEYTEYGTRALWRSLGKSRNRIYELTITEPVKIVLIGAYGNLKACKF